jgi:hypothetical protein
MSRLGTLPAILSRSLPSACAIAAVIALGGSALSQEAPGKDEVFGATSIVTGFGTQKIASFDISFVDSTIHTYVLGDRTNKAVDVVDTSNNKLVTQLMAVNPPFAGVATSCATGNNNDCSGPDGVIIIRGKEVWAGDGNSTVRVFDLTTDMQTHNISTGGSFRADEMCFDPVDNLVMVANNADSPPFATLISTTTYTVVTNGKIPFDGKNGAPESNNGAEQCQWSPKTGKFYISIPGIVGGINGGGGVAVIDPKTKTVIKTFLINGNDCIAPQGMALGPSNQILLGCNGDSGNGKFSTVIINQNSGAITKVLDNESGADEVWFNPGDGHYFLARSSANVGGFQQLGIVDSNGGKEDQSLPTAVAGTRNAHSVAADSRTNQVYFPIPADIESSPDMDTPGTPDGTKVSTVCSSALGLTAGTPAADAADDQGCIAVFTVVKGKDDKFARQRGQDDKQD